MVGLGHGVARFAISSGSWTVAGIGLIVRRSWEALSSEILVEDCCFLLNEGGKLRGSRL